MSLNSIDECQGNNLLHAVEANFIDFNKTSILYGHWASSFIAHDIFGIVYFNKIPQNLAW